jgi:hypothetical protein
MNKTFQADDLKIEVKVERTLVCLTWLGQSNSRDPSAVLRPLFDELTGHVSKEREVELDFRSFEYMNSSAFRPILLFVQQASKSSRGVRVRYDSRKNWQRLSFKTLQAVSASLGNVVVEA